MASKKSNRWQILAACVGLVALAVGAIIWQQRAAALPRVWRFTQPAYAENANSDDFRQEATRVANQVVADLPDTTDGQAVAARLDYSLGRSDEAVAHWRKAIEIDPDFANGHFALGVIAKDAAEHEEAIRWLQNSLRLAPFDPHTPPLIADVLIKMSRFEEAIEVLREYMTNQEASAKSVRDLGHCFLELDRLEEARQTFETMVEHYPDDSSALTTAYYSLARVYMRLGDTERAAECRRKFEQVKPVDSEIVDDSRKYQDVNWLRNLLVKTLWEGGQAYRAHGRDSAAEEMWQRAAQLDNAHVDCRLQLMALYEQQEKPHEGLRIAEQLCEVDPQNSDFWLNRGVLLARVGELSPALEAIGRAIEINPGNAQYRQAYQTIQAAAGG